MHIRIYGLALLLAFSINQAADAASGHIDIPKYKDWTFTGVTGTFDKHELQRGFQVYREVCATCHSLKYIAFRNLEDLGYTENEIKALAATYSVIDGPNDAGDMFERPARTSDHIPGPYANDQQARVANGGALPPDLSLITKARGNGLEGSGSNYVRALLEGYTSPPAGFTVMNGMYYNKYFPGHQIAMPNPLSDGVVSYADGSPETLVQYTKDVTAFLTWTAEPHLQRRKETGLKVFVYLAFLVVFSYLAKKKVWSKLH